MRFIILILAILFSCSSFGQDSLQIDTSSKPSILTSQDPVFADSVSDTLKKSVVNKKKQKNKAKKIKAQEAPISDDLENRGDVYVSENYNGAIIIFLIIIGVIAFLVFHRSIPATTYENDSSSSKDDELSDYINRMILPRREYYRNVYLKSEEWKRKRYLVLKRDNWRCVYCGGKATQVHHTRYAKRNIGKEPIEWLVSICKTCHDSKHQ